jgi:hypothetical protein
VRAVGNGGAGVGAVAQPANNSMAPAMMSESFTPASFILVSSLSREFQAAKNVTASSPFRHGFVTELNLNDIRLYFI